MWCKNGIFSGNLLKIIALIAMTADHAGAYLLPRMSVLRIIGRLAFPIFAYMLAEGCRYTKNRKKYLWTLGGTAFLFQMLAFFVTGSGKQFVLVTFFLSAVLCFLADNARKSEDGSWRLAVCGWLVFVFIVTIVFPLGLKKFDFSVDYGLPGVLFPAAVFMAEKKSDKLFLCAFMCVMISVASAPVQWWSLAALPLIALYNGKRGFSGMKYFYYAYFPLHLIFIWIIDAAVR